MRPIIRRRPRPRILAKKLSPADVAGVRSTKVKSIKLNHSYIRYWVPVAVWAALIFYASSVPAVNIPDLGIFGTDKFAHFLEFLVFGILLTRAMLGQGPKISLSWTIVLSIIIAIFYAAIDEWHQMVIPGRQTDILDFLADVAGIVVGSLLLLRRYLGAKDTTV